MAAAIDGVSIMLGTAIDRRARRAPFEGITFAFAQIVLGAKKAIKTALYYWKRPGYRYINVADSETIMARAAVSYIELKIEKSGSDFLADLLAAIDPIKRIVDYDELMKNPSPIMTTGYRLILEAFRHPSLKWVIAKKDTWVFEDPDSYSEFCKWVSEEIVYQAEQEGTIASYATNEQYSSPKVVKFRRPLAA